MTWIDSLENPEAVKSVFGITPSLDSIDLILITMNRDGPTVTLNIALNETPSTSSAKWQKIGANAVTLDLQLLAVETLSVDGWSSDTNVKLKIDQSDDGKIRVLALGTRIKLDCTCRFIKVHSITGYRRVVQV